MFKKVYLVYLFLSINYLSISQTYEDVLRYNSFNHEGTSRFNSMGGAFGALGGDLSAIAINPAGSAVFNNGHFSLSFGSDKKANQASLLNSSNNFDKKNITLNQIGGIINFENLEVN